MNKSKILKFAGISMLGLGVVAVPTVMLVSCASTAAYTLTLAQTTAGEIAVGATDIVKHTLVDANGVDITATYTASSDTATVATVTVAGDVITVKGVAAGKATITVTATIAVTGKDPIVVTKTIVYTVKAAA